MEARTRLLFFLLLCSGCSGREDGTRAPVAETPDSNEPRASASTSVWKTSEDGMLSLRLTAHETLLQPSEPIPIVVELRNNSDQPINIIRPFGDWYYALAVGIALRGPQGTIEYSGATPSYELGADAFSRLQPGEVVEDRTELTLDQFANSDMPGRYTIAYEYVAQSWQEAASREGFDNLWMGTIASGPVNVTKRDENRMTLK